LVFCEYICSIASFLGVHPQPDGRGAAGLSPKIEFKIKANFRVTGVTHDAKWDKRVLINGAHTIDEDGSVEVASLAFEFKKAKAPTAQRLVNLCVQHEPGSFTGARRRRRRRRRR
jgi:hypothetical protein